MGATDALRDALSGLWSEASLVDGGPFDEVDGMQGFPAVLEATMNQIYGSSANPDCENLVREALFNAFRSLGARHSIDLLGLSQETAIAALHAALTASSVDLVHLTPLNMCGEFPDCNFGPCQLRASVAATELAELLNPRHLDRFFPDHGLDVEHLSYFPWLIVRESVPVAELAVRVHSQRSLLAMSVHDASEVHLRLHRSLIPPIVERALFVALLYPWEERIAPPTAPWKPFRPGWTYTVSSDLLAHPDPPPAADSVAFEVVTEIDWYDRISVIRAAQFKGEFSDLRGELCNWWEIAERACPRGATVGAFNPHIAHFMVKALLDDGIDEMMAHATMIDAAMILDGKGMTKRTAKRVAQLLVDPLAKQEFMDLYKLRSSYVHGQSLPGTPKHLPANLKQEQLNRLRRLARRVSAELLCLVDASGANDRKELLERLAPARREPPADCRCAAGP